MTKRNEPSPRERIKRPPATTPEASEAILISLASDVAEQQMLDGTASAQVIIHYLKLGSGREKLEREKLRQENELLKSKVEQIEGRQREDELYQKAIEAFQTYSGNEEYED